MTAAAAQGELAVRGKMRTDSTGESSAAEVMRIQQVYRRYLADAATLKRWNCETSYKRLAARERLDCFRALLREAGVEDLSSKTVLEIGCWTGGTLGEVLELGATAANVHGVDLLEEAVVEARHRFPQIDIRMANAEELPFTGGTFDVVVQSTMFSSMLQKRMAANVAQEMVRVLTPGGAILWYDLRQPNPWNRNVRALCRSEIQSLFPGFQLSARSITVNPKVGQAMAGMSEATYRLLARVPALRSHLAALLRRVPPGSEE